MFFELYFLHFISNGLSGVIISTIWRTSIVALLKISVYYIYHRGTNIWFDQAQSKIIGLQDRQIYIKKTC